MRVVGRYALGETEEGAEGVGSSLIAERLGSGADDERVAIIQTIDDELATLFGE